MTDTPLNGKTRFQPQLDRLARLRAIIESDTATEHGKEAAKIEEKTLLKEINEQLEKSIKESELK